MSIDEIIREVEKALQELESARERCMKRLYKTKEVEDIVVAYDRTLDNILPSDSDAFRIFDRARRERTLWWTTTLNGYVDPTDCSYLDHRIAIIKEILNALELGFLGSKREGKEQFFFDQGETYLGKRRFLKLTMRASKKLTIVDPYLDVDVFDYIDELDPVITIELVLGRTKRAFQTLYHALKQSRGNIEAKENHDCHDRFLVIDDAEVWHMGASINGIGKKAFMIDKVTDPEPRNKFLTSLSEWWKNANTI
jgi:hypothetical protein